MGSKLPVAGLVVVAAVVASFVLLAGAGPAAARTELAPVQTPAPASPDPTVAAYVEDWLAFHPSRATAAGRHGFDHRLEDRSPAALAAWVERNRRARRELLALLSEPGGDVENRADRELALARVERELWTHGAARRPDRDPLYWTSTLANAPVFLLVRDHRPAEERVAALAERASRVPVLVLHARRRLAATAPEEIAPELARLAAGQAASAGRFHRDGFAAFAAERRAAGDVPPEALDTLVDAGAAAAVALDGLAAFLEDLAAEATGSPRLGRELYAAVFRIETGLDDPDAVLAAAEADLVTTRRRAAEIGRSVWRQVLGPAAADPPADDRALLRILFERVAEDRVGAGQELSRAAAVEAFVAQYRRLVDEAFRFAEERGIVTVEHPRTLWIGPSPSFFIGQSVGGVYPAGPWEPEADTLFYLPTPADDATAAQRDAFFRDFNDHFNRMIVPHEMVPGHYLHLQAAAHHPRKVRALFGDGVAVEGWGTFSERLALDHGWGGPGWGGALDRLAHWKKRLENVARTVVDIRIHVHGMEREAVLAYARDEALLDEQFAANLWTRSITSAPQLVSYHLGTERVEELHAAVRRERGEAFVLREFTDAVLDAGAVSVEHLRRTLLAAPETSPASTIEERLESPAPGPGGGTGS